MHVQKNSRNNLLTSVIILTVAIAFACCNRKTIFSHYETISSDGWNRRDTICFSINPSEKTESATGLLSIRVNENYPFTALSLVVNQQIIPNGAHYQDTLYFTLVDNKGRFLGQGINHHTFQHPLHIYELGEDQHLSVKVHHLMTQQRLPGIINVGISLEHN